MQKYSPPFAGRNRLRELRERHHLTTEQIACFLGITRVSYHRLEHGADVRLSYALRLARFYNVTIHDLWEQAHEATA